MPIKKVSLRKKSNPVEKARVQLIKAQKRAEKAYKMVEKAQQKYKAAQEKAAKKKSTSKKSTSKKSKKVTKKRVSKKIRGGGGSDWLNTVNSRGNVAGPNDHWGVPGGKWFDQFEKSGDYIPMSTLRQGSDALRTQSKVSIPGGLFKDSQKYESVSKSAVDLPTQIGV